ncbi:MAG: 30S ribosomal protein S15 [Nitrosopumilus sp.]|nr:30S ribosomal protein S15 [Nitrosopumilus sp.]MBL7015061.1 30S ribosomal protein S15 [Nitrosopumilus sp.]
MGRMHTHRHGKSHSIRPATPRAPSWITQSPAEIEGLIIKYTKDGLTPSQIGIKLRDQHSIPLVKAITNKKMGQILEENDLKAEMPEDLENIVRKAVNLQKHLKSNKGDNRNVRSLELIEAKVHRLSVYYKRIERIPKTWKYKSVVAQLE